MKGYTIHHQRAGGIVSYELRNPAGVPIAFDMSWRVARKIADALNAQQVKP